MDALTVHRLHFAFTVTFHYEIFAVNFNGDGICESTGKPVGEGRGPMNRRGRGMGGNCPNGAPQSPSN
jgi:hypothetical protein